jgi:hypothetical protein
MPVVDVKDGQGYSGDFDYRRKTSAGAIYQPQFVTPEWFK